MATNLTKVAFLTYNTVGDPGEVANGWHERNGRRALVLQGPTNQWHLMRLIAGSTVGSSSKVDLAVAGQIDNLWDSLLKALPELDHVVIYVGIGGANRAIELAAQLPPEKVTFLFCSCGRNSKIALMNEKVPGARLMETTFCGGCMQMLGLFTSFLENGDLKRPML